MKRPSRTSRREFGRLAGAAGVAGIAAGLARAGQGSAGPAPPEADPPGSPPAGPQKWAPRVSSLTDFILEAYEPDPATIDDDVLHIDVRDMLAGGGELRKIPLTNADEPDFAFRPETGRPKPAPAGRRPGRKAR